MSVARLGVAALLAVEAALLAHGAEGFAADLDATMSLRRLLLVQPARAVATQCAPEPRSDGVLACTRTLAWRVGGAFVSVCDGAPPAPDDPRFQLPRHWRLSLACQVGGQRRLALPLLTLALFR